MFVQALARYADTRLRDKLDDVAFEDRPVPYMLRVNKDGSFAGLGERFSETAAPAKKKAKAKADAPPKTIRRAEMLSVPRSPANRNAGLHPLLASDDMKYVLGPGAWTKPGEAANHQERHSAFVALVRRVAQETKEPALAACALFYDQPAQVERAREAFAKATPGSNVVLTVFGEPVTEREPLRTWWRQHYKASTSERSSVETAECLISGIVGPIPPTHAKIKGATALGGLSAGVSLMSFDKAAFRSYGWEQNANSPVSADRAMAYVLALNDLLKPGSRHREDFEGVAFLIWLKQETGLDYRSLLKEPPDESLLDQARAVLRLKKNSTLKRAERNELYMASVSATGSRLVLRSWSTQPLEEAIQNLVSFWNDLRMQPLDQKAGPRAEPFWKLLYAMDRKGEPPANRVVALRKRALEGPHSPLGYRIVADVLARMRVDKDKRKDLAALGLLRLCLNDVDANLGREKKMPAQLDETDPHTHPAYVCGRLLALHDSLQWRTFESAGETQPNSTVEDRYYTLVMNSPAIGLAKVFDLGRKHLSKLRKLDTKKGTPFANSFTARICALVEMLDGRPPAQFNLHDKARFALGFYHEKAPRFRAPRNSGNPPADLSDINAANETNGSNETNEGNQ